MSPYILKPAGGFSLHGLNIYFSGSFDDIFVQMRKKMLENKYKLEKRFKPKNYRNDITAASSR